MVALLLAYLYKRFGHRLKFSALNLPSQPRRNSIELLPVKVQTRSGAHLLKQRNF